MGPTEAMRGKVVMVTGASAGIGKETALGLARMGARVLVVSRDEARGKSAAEEIRKKATGSDGVELFLADLSSQAAVRRLAEQVATAHSRLDVLINNAGVIMPQRAVSVDGIEMQLAVNHLAPFLLTNLLREVLVAGAPARVVGVASQVERRGSIDFDDLQAERRYEPLTTYFQTKLANVLFTYELARRLEGTGVTANCLHPGVIATNLLSDYLGRPRPLGFLAKLNNPGPAEGARASIRLASDPALAAVTGRYFHQTREAESSPMSRDVQVARRLWDVSAALTGLGSSSVSPTS